MQGKQDPLRVAGTPTPLGLLIEVIEDVSIITLIFIFTARLAG